MPTKVELEIEVANLQRQLAKVEARINDAIDNEEICEEGGQEALKDLGFKRIYPEKSWEGSCSITISFDGRATAEENGYGAQFPETLEEELSEIIYDVVYNAINKKASFPGGFKVRVDCIDNFEAREDY